MWRRIARWLQSVRDTMGNPAGFGWSESGDLSVEDHCIDRPLSDPVDRLGAVGLGYSPLIGGALHPRMAVVLRWFLWRASPFRVSFVSEGFSVAGQAGGAAKVTRSKVPGERDERVNGSRRGMRSVADGAGPEAAYAVRTYAEVNSPSDNGQS